MIIPFKKDPIEFNQRVLFPTNIFDLLPKDHSCFVYKDIFEQLDTSSVEKLFSIRGQNANDKKEVKKALKEIYRKRKKIVEPVFGQIKNSGFRGFSLREDEKVKGKFSLVCAVHNFRKIVKAVLRGKVCLESVQLAPMVA